MDPSKFSLTTDPDDPQNSVIITGDIMRLAAVFVPSQPFTSHAEPLNAEAEHARELLLNPNAGPPLTESERASQSWRMDAGKYRSLYECVIMRGEKTFNPRTSVAPAPARPASTSARSAPRDNESTISGIPAPLAAHRKAPLVRPAMAPPATRSAAAPAPRHNDDALHDVHALLKVVAKDVAALKDRMQYSMQILLDVRDSIGAGPEDEAGETDEEEDEPEPKRAKGDDQ